MSLGCTRTSSCLCGQWERVGGALLDSADRNDHDGVRRVPRLPPPGIPSKRPLEGKGIMSSGRSPSPVPRVPLGLGIARIQHCPIGGHWTLVFPVREASLTDEERLFAAEHHDIRIP